MHRDDFREPERRRVAHIVVKDKETAAKVLALAKKANPRDWGNLFQKYSLDAPKKGAVAPPIEMAGDLGIVGVPGDARGDNPRVPAAVRAAVFEIGAVGEVLGRAVQDEGGFHLVRLVGKTDAHERSLADADRSIRVALLQARIAERESALEASLGRQFPVTRRASVAAVDVPRAPASHAGAAKSPGWPAPRGDRAPLTLAAGRVRLSPCRAREAVGAATGPTSCGGGDDGAELGSTSSSPGTKARGAAVKKQGPHRDHALLLAGPARSDLPGSDASAAHDEAREVAGDPDPRREGARGGPDLVCRYPTAPPPGVDRCSVYCRSARGRAWSVPVEAFDPDHLGQLPGSAHPEIRDVIVSGRPT
jgi:hypothetical protein